MNTRNLYCLCLYNLWLLWGLWFCQYLISNNIIYETMYVCNVCVCVWLCARARVRFQDVEMLTPFEDLCYVGFIKPIGVVAGVRRQRLDFSIWPISVGSTWRRRQNTASETSPFSKKDEWWIMSLILIALPEIVLEFNWLPAHEAQNLTTICDPVA
jgi:hypothetical protein